MAKYLVLFLGLNLWLRIGAFLVDAVMWLMIGLLFLSDWLTQRQRQHRHQHRHQGSTSWEKDSAKPADVK